MANQKISDGELLVSPTAQAAVAVIDPGLDPTKNFKGDRATLMKMLKVLPVDQVSVAASTTLPLTVAAHQGATIALAGAGATISLNATTVGDGFICTIINATGSDWTVPSITGATLRFGTAGHSKIAQGGTGGIEIITIGGTRYANITGQTA